MKPPIHFARGFVQRALSTEETEVEALKRMGEADMLRQELDAVHRPLWGYLRRLRQNRQSGKVWELGRAPGSLATQSTANASPG